MLTAMQFQVGEKITGEESGAVYVIESVDYDRPNDFPSEEYETNQYSENVEIETAADDLLDFTERNPFGTF